MKWNSNSELSTLMRKQFQTSLSKKSEIKPLQRLGHELTKMFHIKDFVAKLFESHHSGTISKCF